jgi:hypothetical protein
MFFFNYVSHNYQYVNRGGIAYRRTFLLGLIGIIIFEPFID